MNKALKFAIAVLFAGSLTAAGCTDDGTLFAPAPVLETAHSGYAIGSRPEMNLPTSLPGTDTTSTTPPTR